MDHAELRVQVGLGIMTAFASYLPPWWPGGRSSCRPGPGAPVGEVKGQHGVQVGVCNVGCTW